MTKPKVSLEDCTQPMLARIVKLVDKLGVKSSKGSWKEYRKSLYLKSKFEDPARHDKEHLLGFLASVVASEAVPKPKKVVNRIAQWTQVIQDERAALGSHHLLVAYGTHLSANGRGTAAAVRGHSSTAAANGAPHPASERSKGGPAQQKAAGGAGRPAAAVAAAAVGAGIHPSWGLVERTRAHDHFARLYDFPSWQKGWTRTSRLPAPDLTAAPLLLGIDCEMCATSSNDKELLAVAVVDQSGKTLVRELVQPEGIVVDLRTSLTGVTPEALQGVTLTRRQLLKQHLVPLLGPQVVLVGHALHNDLAALQLDHHPVIDTSLLFRYKGLAQATPSLVHLAQLLTGRSLRGASGEGVHDSEEDAAAALALVQREVQQQEPTPPLDRPATKVDKALLKQLLVHHLPPGTSAGDVTAALAAAAPGAPGPSALEEGQLAVGRLALVFKHAGEVEALFQALPGKLSSDSMGRRTKEVALPGGGQARVRKMACHNGMAFGQDLKKDRGAPKGKASGKRKAGPSGAKHSVKQKYRKR